MNVVIDTNVLVSALLNPGGAPAKILDMLLNGRFTAVTSMDILSEYEDVLKREKFKFNTRDINDLLVYIRRYSETALPLKHAAQKDMRHEDDRKFLTAAMSTNAEYLITGNLRHFPAQKHGKPRIVSPAEFLYIIK